MIWVREKRNLRGQQKAHALSHVFSKQAFMNKLQFKVTLGITQAMSQWLFFIRCYVMLWASMVAQILKNLPAVAGDQGLILRLGVSPGEGNGKPLQFSCL